MHLDLQRVLQRTQCLITSPKASHYLLFKFPRLWNSESETQDLNENVKSWGLLHDWMLMWDPTADNSTFFPVGARHVLFKTLAGKVEKDVPNPPIIIQLAELLQADIPYISWLCTLAVTYIPCEYVYHRIGIKVASKMASEIRTVGLGLLSEYWKCFWGRNGWNDWTVQTAKTLDYGRCSSQGILLFFLFFCCWRDHIVFKCLSIW